MKRKDKANERKIKALERMVIAKRKIVVHQYETPETRLSKCIKLAQLTIAMRNTKVCLV